MNDRFGMHLPATARPFSQAEMDHVIRLHPRWLVALVFAPGVVPQAASQVAELVSRTGAGLILRPYVPAPAVTWGRDPLGWGETAAEWIEPYLHLRPVVVLDNEPNHEDDGGVTDPGRIAAFWADSAYGLRDTLRGGSPRLALPPLSPGVPGYRDLYREIAWRVGYIFEDVCVHCYARTANWDDIEWLEGLFRSRVLVKEFDSYLEPHQRGLDGRCYLDLGYCLGKLARARAVCWFLLSTEVPAFRQFDYLRNEEEIMSNKVIRSGDCLLFAQWEGQFHDGYPASAWWDLEAALESVRRRLMTVTFSRDDAAKYERVYAVGGPGGVSEDALERLRSLGCQVWRVWGPAIGLPDTAEATRTALAQLAVDAFPKV